MKIAVLISGQVRICGTYKFLYKLFVSRLKSDIYLSTWNGYGVDETLEAFKPVKYSIVDPTKFPSLKQTFWDEYKKLQNNSKIIDGRFRYINGDIKSKKYDVVRPDNTFRMFYLNQQAINLVEDSYDIVVKIRPDLRLTGFPDLNQFELSPNSIYTPKNQYRNDHKNQYTGDQVFFGSQDIMHKTMSLWSVFPKYAAEIEDNILPPVSTCWLHPEAALKRYIEIMCNGQCIPVSNFHGKPEEITSPLAREHGWIAAYNPIVEINK